jgi:hypothetical protein
MESPPSTSFHVAKQWFFDGDDDGQLAGVGLDSLPIEVLVKILWSSRELSLISVCRRFHAGLPAFARLARSFAVLAFCELDGVASAAERDLRCFQGPVTLDFLRRFRLPADADLALPLSPEARADLQRDVLCSGWWSIDRFYALHLFVWRRHLYAVESRRRQNLFWMEAAPLQQFGHLVRQTKDEWRSISTPPAQACIEGEDAGGPPPPPPPPAAAAPPVLPWKTMPRCQLIMATNKRRHQRVKAVPVHLTVGQTRFGFRCPGHPAVVVQWDLLDINVDDAGRDDFAHNVRTVRFNTDDDRHVPDPEQTQEYHLPPRPLLTAPFTARKRGVLTYLVQEAGGKSFITDDRRRRQGPTEEQDAQLIHRAILDAIPLGDVRFLQILLEFARMVAIWRFVEDPDPMRSGGGEADDDVNMNESPDVDMPESPDVDMYESPDGAEEAEEELMTDTPVQGHPVYLLNLYLWAAMVHGQPAILSALTDLCAHAWDFVSVADVDDFRADMYGRLLKSHDLDPDDPEVGRFFDDDSTATATTFSDTFVALRKAIDDSISKSLTELQKQIAAAQARRDAQVEELRSMRADYSDSESDD